MLNPDEEGIKQPIETEIAKLQEISEANKKA
jgi:hypothetical protein